MNPYKRSPFIKVATVLVYFFLYAPIIGLMVFAFNSSRTNVFFGGFISQWGPCKWMVVRWCRVPAGHSTGFVI